MNRCVLAARMLVAVHHSPEAPLSTLPQRGRGPWTFLCCNSMRLNFLLAVFLVLFPLSLMANEEKKPASKTIRLLEQITALGPRSIGSPGHDQASRIIEAYLSDLGAGQLITHDMEQVVPVVDSAYIEWEEGQQFPVYPLWPNGARLCSTRPDGIFGPLLYIGDGHEKSLPIRRLAGAIVAMEYNCHDRWKQVLACGALAILFLPPQNTTWVQSHHKFADIMFDAPRFYIDHPELADRIRNATDPPHESKRVRIVSRIQWASAPVRNLLWVRQGQDRQLSEEVVVVTSRLDASCVVPQLAFGAEQAISAAVNCELAETLVHNAPGRTVVLAWTGAQTMNFASLRAILGAAMGKGKTAEQRLSKLRTTKQTLDRTKEQLKQQPRETLGAQSTVRVRYETQIKYRLVEVRKELSTRRRHQGPNANDGLAALVEQEQQLNALVVSLQRNRIGDRHWRQLKDLTSPVLARIDTELANFKQQIDHLDRDIHFIRPLLTRDRVAALLALDLTSQGPAFGLYWQTHWQAEDLFPIMSRLGQKLTSLRSIDLNAIDGLDAEGHRRGRPPLIFSHLPFDNRKL